MECTQYELNRELLTAAEKHEFDIIEELLKLGADPLGSSDENDPDEHILGELFCYASDDLVLAEALPQMLERFFAYGMDIKSRNIPAGDGDNINPLWSLAFCQRTNGLNILKVMLDHNLDTVSAEELVEHIFVDMDKCDGCEIEDERFLDITICALKMVMLTASYSHIIYASKYIRECIELESNHEENLYGFRDWDKYTYHIDKSTCTNIPHGLQNATLTIRDIHTNEVVWKMKI